MAKKEYPGLVLVPPSDRTILRRRLLRWGLLLIPVVWVIWTVLGSLPASQDTTDCQEEIGEGTLRNQAEDCGRPDQAAATVESREEDVSHTSTAQSEDRAEPPPSIPAPPPKNDKLSPGPTPHVDPPPKPAAKPDPPVNQTAVQPSQETSATRTPVKKPAANQNPDAQLAEQGDAFAQYRLGKYYAKQKGRQAPESISWYKKAATGLRRLADAGNGQAMYVLGVMYAYGRGMVQNTEEARHWLSKAVRKNVTEAQPVLAGLESRPSADPKLKDKKSAHSTKR